MDLPEFHDQDDIIYFIVVREAKNIIIFDGIDTFFWGRVLCKFDRNRS